MKNFIVFTFMLILLLLCNIQTIDFKTYSEIFNQNTFDVQIFSGSKDDINYACYEDNGQGRVYFCYDSNYQSILDKLESVNAITFIFENIDISAIYKNLDIKVAEKTDNGFLGYVKNLPNFHIYKNKKVNIQASQSQGKLYVGYPMLLGCY